MGRDFRKIEAYQLADSLVISLYKATKKFPREELFGLTSQMRRAAVSIPANIAEGATRKSKKEYLHFLYISMGSMAELEYYVQLSKKMEYMDEKEFEIVEGKRRETAGKLFRLKEAVEREAMGTGPQDRRTHDCRTQVLRSCSHEACPKTYEVS